MGDETKLAEIERRLLAVEMREPAYSAAVQEAARLRAAFATLETDGHMFSSRPCETCRNVSNVTGRPFGCTLRAMRRGDHHG